MVDNEKTKKQVVKGPELFLKINPDNFDKKFLDDKSLNDFSNKYFKLVLKVPLVNSSSYAEKNFRKNKATNAIKAKLNELSFEKQIITSTETNHDPQKSIFSLKKNCFLIISKNSFSEDVFRSVRNSIAHGNFYRAKNGYLFFNLSRVINGEKKIKFFMFLKDLKFLDALIEMIKNKDMYN